MFLAHKIALDPTNKQKTYFAQGAGVARFAYNWALEEWNRQYEAHKLDRSLPIPSEASLRRQLTALKREKLPWMYSVAKSAAEESIIDLGVAFDAFINKRANCPIFKRRGVSDSFCAASQTRLIHTEKRKLKLPLIGWVRMREEVRFAGTLKRVTVSRKADRWYASILVETEKPAKAEHEQEAIGIDLGLKVLATLSKGPPIQGPKAHSKSLARIRRLDRAVSRKQRDSKNAAKAVKAMARLYAKTANIRKDVSHKATTELTKTYKRIGIEDLHVLGMVKNHKLARRIMDASWFQIREQLTYKAKMYGSVVVVADRWFPSSKKCSCCGAVKTVLALSERTFHCEVCGFECDRDLNAAKNLEKIAEGSAVTVCGENRSGPAARRSRVKRTSTKQKPDSESRVGSGEQSSIDNPFAFVARNPFIRNPFARNMTPVKQEPEIESSVDFEVSPSARDSVTEPDVSENNYREKITFRLTTEQKQQLEQAATKSRISPSEWTRRQIMKALGPDHEEHRILRLIAFQSEVNRLTVVAATVSEDIASDASRKRIEEQAEASSKKLLARWLVTKGK